MTSEQISEQVVCLLLDQKKIEDEFNLIIEEHSKQTNLNEVQQVLHELLVAWKSKQVETIAAQVKLLRYKRDANDLSLCRVDAQLTDEQREYLCQYYAINKHPGPDELQLIAKQFNNDDFNFFLDLQDWFLGRRMAEAEAAQRRWLARKAAA